MRADRQMFNSYIFMSLTLFIACALCLDDDVQARVGGKCIHEDPTLHYKSKRSLIIELVVFICSCSCTSPYTLYLSCFYVITIGMWEENGKQ